MRTSRAASMTRGVAPTDPPAYLAEYDQLTLARMLVAEGDAELAGAGGAGRAQRDPLTAGTARLIQLAGGPAVIPADHRFASFPLPLVVRIVGATTYALAGILQFVPQFRGRHLAWHRRAGRVLAVAGLLVAISALRMTLSAAPPSAARLGTRAALPQEHRHEPPGRRHHRPGLDLPDPRGRSPRRALVRLARRLRADPR